MRRLSLLLFVCAAACGQTASSGGGTGGTATTEGATFGAGASGGTSQAGGGGAGGSMIPGTVRIIVEPSDAGDSVVQAIQGAKTSVHMTMYELTSGDVIDALVAQQGAGHEVAVLLNKTFPFTGSPNQDAFDRLQQAGVTVEWAPSKFTFTHEKTMIIDGNVAWIMTMNAVSSSPLGNREYLAVDTEPLDVAEAETIFQADLQGLDTHETNPLVVAPDDAREKLAFMIGSAKSTLDVEVEELSDDTITQALVSAAARMVTIRVVLSDGNASPAMSQSIMTLTQAGIGVVILHDPYVHAKAIVADGTSVYVGSENFTFNSLSDNRELGLITTVPTAVQTVAMTVAADFAKGDPQ